MKKLYPLLLCVFLLSIVSCAKIQEGRINLNPEEKKSNYSSEITISPMDFVTIKSDKIIIAPEKEDETYTISGYFNGQILCTTKNTIIKLNNAYLENKSGLAALRCESKAEVSLVKDSENYLVSSGRAYTRSAALQGKRGLVIGGSGKLYVKGNLCHAFEAEDVKLKGTGTYYFQGTKKGSAISCETFAVEKDKTFTAYILNSKNGIKADRTISIASGNFYIYDNGTMMKTETKADSEKHAHFITLSGGTFHTAGNRVDFVTENGALNYKDAEIIEE